MTEINEIAEGIFKEHDEVFKALQKSEEMNKEVEALEWLKQEEVDIQLVFLRYLLDREFTRGRISEEYSLKYSILPEDKKWELARALDKAYRCNLDAWTHDMGYVIDVIDSKFYENNE